MTFTQSVSQNDGPPPDERYVQERALLEFFVFGYSAIENAVYACHALASLACPDKISFASTKDFKLADPSKTSKVFLTEFPFDKLSNTLEHLLKEKEFEGWRDARNILSHRGSPPRNFNMGGEKHGLVDWKNMGLLIDKNLTAQRMVWLSKVINELIFSARDFAFAHF